jgi:hypothetical protein
LLPATGCAVMLLWKVDGLAFGRVLLRQAGNASAERD